MFMYADATFVHDNNPRMKSILENITKTEAGKIVSFFHLSVIISVMLNI